MPQNVLLIQDDLTGADAVRDALTGCRGGSFNLIRTSGCAEGLKQLTRSSAVGHDASLHINALIVDISRADGAGIATFEQIHRAVPQLPILILSAELDEGSAQIVVQRGALDYLLKERLDGYSLPKALRGVVERAVTVEALFEEKERAQVTLNSIGENKTVALTPNCVLIRRDGSVCAIEDSAAPIHDRSGSVTGAVMVFRDVTKARAQSEHMEYLAQHDILTGLANRVFLSDRISQAAALDSSTSMIPLGMMQAIACCRRYHDDWYSACASPIRSVARAEMNSWCCSLSLVQPPMPLS